MSQLLHNKPKKPSETPRSWESMFSNSFHLSFLKYRALLKILWRCPMKNAIHSLNMHILLSSCVSVSVMSNLSSLETCYKLKEIDKILNQ
ncbi:hypothetical protein T05_1945 [Trichinella murrelli]|uniref:Uncharacterized protein n=1 Tax=Trichinella murrelli TaxID=144512 RepID=A0A0V0U4H9_9BILA|nr:hypothetical protein T05_1945 [Trichinella murrelli]